MLQFIIWVWYSRIFVYDAYSSEKKGREKTAKSELKKKKQNTKKQPTKQTQNYNTLYVKIPDLVK